MEVIAERISLKFVQWQVVDARDQERLRYGIELLASIVLKGIFLLAAAAILGKLAQMVAFMVGFCVIRPYCGGTHAKTFLGCFVATSGVAAATILTGEFLAGTLSHWAPLIVSGAVIFSLASVWRYAPREHPHQPLSEALKARLAVKARRTTAALGGMLCLLSVLGIAQPLVLVATVGLVVSAGSTIPLRSLLKAVV